MANTKNTPDWDIVAEIYEVKTKLKSIRDNFSTCQNTEEFPDGHDIYLFLNQELEILRQEIRQLEKENTGHIHPDPIYS